MARFVRSLPGVELVRTYRWGWLRFDAVAGLALTSLLVPVGMAYAELAGLPPVTGLYAGVAALIAYAVFGPSPTLTFGPDSALAPMTAAAILPLAGTGQDPERAIEVAGILAILVGLLCIGAALARLGSLTELLSKPVRIGYLNGLAIIVVAGQLPKLLGFTAPGDDVVSKLRGFVEGIQASRTVAAATAMGIGSLLLILAARRWTPAVPSALVCVVVTTIITAVLDLAQRGVPVVGVVPAGLPRPEVPLPSLQDLKDLILPAAGIAFVALADTATVARAFAAKRGDTFQPTSEIVAMGATNVAAGLFHGIPVSASGGRSAVAQAAGARTQMTSVVGAVAIVATLLFANELLTNLPLSVLAAIIITSATRLFDAGALVWMFRVRRTELGLSLAALIGVAIVGVLPGIVVAIALSLAAFVRRAWRPYSAVLGRVPGEQGYHDLARRPNAVEVPGLLLYRFDAPLFFANADYFAGQISAASHGREPPVQWVIVAAEPITDIDTSAADALVALLDELEERDITLAFAELKGPPRDRLRDYGIYERLGDDRFFPTVGAAVSAYLATTRTAWTDWTPAPTTSSGTGAPP